MTEPEPRFGETFDFALFCQDSVLFARFLTVFARFFLPVSPDFACFLPRFPRFCVKIPVFCPVLPSFARFSSLHATRPGDRSRGGREKPHRLVLKLSATALEEGKDEEEAYRPFNPPY